MIGVLTLGIFGALGLMGLTRPAWGFSLMILFFALEVSLQASVAPFRAFPPLANFCLALVVGAGVAVAFVRNRQHFTGTLTLGLMCTFLIFMWSITSLAWSPAVADAHNHGANIIRTEWPYFLLVILAAPLLVDGLEDWNLARQIVLIFGGLTVITVLINPEFTIKLGRIGIALDGINRTSPLAIGEMGGTLAIIGALYRGRLAGRASTVLGLSGFLLGAVLALYSGSRGQAIFALLSTLCLYPVSRQLKNAASFIGSALVLVFAIGLAYIAFTAVTGESDIDRWRVDRVEDASGIRLQNIGVLLGAFVGDPRAWFVGLGFNAFSAIENDLGQGYSHCVFVDVLCELGIPMFIALLTVLGLAIRSGRRLFLRFQDDPASRSAVATLLALLLYQFFICNKEGNLWSSVNFFMLCLVLIRIDARESLELPIARAAEFGDSQESGEPYDGVSGGASPKPAA